MAKITVHDKKGRDTVTVKTQSAAKKANQPFQWWEAKSKAERLNQLLSTFEFLRTQNNYRYRQALIFARLYGNMSLSTFVGTNLNKIAPTGPLPIDRPTFNIVQSCTDTLVSRLTQSRPRPIFLSDNGQYRQRNLAKKLNQFVAGEIYNCKGYQLAERTLTDAAILGTGAIKIYEGTDDRVAMERVLVTELLVDYNDSIYGNPRTLYQFKLVDRAVMKAMFNTEGTMIDKAENAFVDNSTDSQETTADQIMVVEAWHLPSGHGRSDGRHVIGCSTGLIVDEQYDKDKFPFVFINYSPRLTGFWAQGLAEQLMGTQVEINKLLMTITQSINLVGVPRVFVEDGSKVVKAHLNNQIGAIVTYRGTKPAYEVAPSNSPELYQQLQRLIDYGYQQSGISALSAASQKPQGLNSGAALREYDDLQSDRFATISKRYENFFIDLAYQIVDKAKDITERTGKYSTVYPSKGSINEVELDKADLVTKNQFVIQCFDTSSLPKDPAGRKQTVIDDMQAGLLSPREGRRLLNYPDLEQVEQLDNAGEELILMILDDIVDKGEEGYKPPEPTMDLQLANELVVKYINLYSTTDLEPEKMQLLRNFYTQIQALTGMAQQAMQQEQMAQQPQAVPQGPPVSDMLPNAPQG